LLASGERNIEIIWRELYSIPGHGRRPRLFLSFGTKLVHTIDGTLPIYDRNIASVLGLPPQTQGVSLEDKIVNRLAIYRELQDKSAKLLKDERIGKYLTELRRELSEKARNDCDWQVNLISREKLLDSALWALYMAIKLNE
jgi:hypothetical protein